MNIRGDKVHLEGLLDYNGLLDLEAKLTALKQLLPKVATGGATEELASD